MQVIPLTVIPNQTFNIVLDDQYCTISLYWRQFRLYLDLYVGAAPIVRGAVCENKANMLQGRMPGFAGSLHFFDLDGDTPPTWERLDSRYVLLYMSGDEDLPDFLRF